MKKIIPYLLPGKDAMPFSSVIPSQLIFPEDDRTVTGKWLNYWYSASCLGGWGQVEKITGWFMVSNTVIYWLLLQLPSFLHLLDYKGCVSTDSFAITIFSTLFSACVATASYCNR